MGLFKYPGSKVWSMEFVFHGQRIRESTGTRNKTLAQKVEDKRRRDLEEGNSRIRKREKPKLFATEASAWLEIKSVSLAPSSVSIAKANLKHLLPVFGKSVVIDIEAVGVARYQRKRIQDGAANKSINLELGTLRAILKRSGRWSQIQPEIKMLKVVEDTGRAISLIEQSALLQACGMSRSRLILPFVTLALETGARFGVIRTLQWGMSTLSIDV